MVKQEIGYLVKSLRKQAGFSQEKLALETGIEQATISKIERGRSTPNKDTITILFQKFGYDLASISNLLLSKEEAEYQRIIDEIDAHLANKRYEEGEALFLKLKDVKEFIKNRFNQQYLLFIEALLEQRKKNIHHEKILDLLIKSMEINITKFREEKIEEYYLSNQELEIINLISIVYFESNMIDKAIYILEALKTNFDNHSIDRNHKGKWYPFILYNLTKYLGISGNRARALELCDIGINVCLDTGYLYSLPKLSFNKAYGLIDIGKEEEGKKLLKEVYYTCLLFKRFKDALHIQTYAKEKLSIDLQHIILN